MNNKTKGIVLMILSSFFFALMATAVKSLPEVGVPEKMFFRNAITLMTASFIIFRKKESFAGNNKKALVLRSIFGLLGVAGNYYALSKLPLADSEILNKTSSFFVIILSVLFLNEKVRKQQVLTIILAFIGALFVIKPGLSFSIIPALTGIFGAFFAGAAYTTVRHLSRTDSPNTIVFYFGLISTLAVVPFMLSGNFILSSLEQFLKLSAIGVSAAIAQYLMAYAYRYAPAGELSIYLYTNIVFSILIGFVIWNEVPDLMSLAGGALIIIAGLINYHIAKQYNRSVSGNQ
ncbi:DMT family transporter [Brassicibacter mesophilus]|uniref:DMT family transporter n=1 Tax=Brassicibacter mesophilus TaxID=745119 RepID=UPI003D19924B